MTPPPPACLSKISGFNSCGFVGFGGGAASEGEFRVTVGMEAEIVGRDGGACCNGAGDSGSGGS